MKLSERELAALAVITDTFQEMDLSWDEGIKVSIAVATKALDFKKDELEIQRNEGCGGCLKKDKHGLITVLTEVKKEKET